MLTRSSAYLEDPVAPEVSLLHSAVSVLILELSVDLPDGNAVAVLGAALETLREFEHLVP